MFVNQHALQYLLRPEHYTSQSHYDLEIQRLFRTSWQLVGTKSELKHHGDFRSFNLFGEQLQLRNEQGHFIAFQNVCPHRHCLLTGLTKGHSDVIRCQYHGWEFKETGKTAFIPEAQCFKPWDRDNSQLSMIRLESCGDLLFVNLSGDAPPLREWLSPYFEETEQAFQAPFWQMKQVLEYECDCNWKVPAENTLESYHIQAVHKKTFGDFFPTEKNSHHTLDARYTALEYDAISKLETYQAKVHEWLGGQSHRTYRHRHMHPNLILCSCDTINYAHSYQPLSPTRVKVRTYFFGVLGHSLMAKIEARLVWQVAKQKTFAVLHEDLGVYHSQQLGLTASHHRGVIGNREERIHAFQKYLLDSLGLPLPENIAAETTSFTQPIRDRVPC